VDLFPDSKELLELFLARDVRFLVIGGHALAAHGIPRGTDDFDLWVWAEHGNAVKITDALDTFGFARDRLTHIHHWCRLRGCVERPVRSST